MKIRTRGENVIWRSSPQDRIGYVIPFVVIEDSPETIVLFQQPGSICKRRSGPRGGPRGRMLLVDHWDGSHTNVEWKGPRGVTRLHLPNSMISVLREWDLDDQRYRGWYVNLEAPWKRTDLGFDSQDFVLDISISEDLGSWSWKDEDEFECAVVSGRLSSQEAERIRAEGKRAVKLIEGQDFPFAHEVWEKWKPDPGWPLARIPPGWDAI